MSVASTDSAAAQAAIDWIKSIVAEPETGHIYEGTVVKIMDFGAFVNFMPNRDGLVHVSEMADHRVEKVTDIVKEGDKVKVMMMGVEKGKIRLSMKRVNQETGEEIKLPPKENPKEKKHHKKEESVETGASLEGALPTADGK